MYGVQTPAWDPSCPGRATVHLKTNIRWDIYDRKVPNSDGMHQLPHEQKEEQQNSALSGQIHFCFTWGARTHMCWTTMAIYHVTLLVSTWHWNLERQDTQWLLYGSVGLYSGNFRSLGSQNRDTFKQSTVQRDTCSVPGVRYLKE